MSRRNSEAQDGLSLVDPLTLLTILTIIGSGGAEMAELIHVTGTSRATVARVLKHARDYFGVHINWTRTEGNHGVYQITDWGLFDGERVMRHKDHNP